MIFSQPHLLWALAGVAALAVVLIVAARRARAKLEFFAEPPLVLRLVTQLRPRQRIVRQSMRLCALAAIVFALAGPKWGFRWEEVRREGIDLIVALDTSRSMLATDVKPNRLERAKLAVLDLLSRLDGDRVGLVAFAGTAFLECPLTLDYAAFSRSLQALHAGIIPRGGSSLSRAIDTSLAGFEARQGKYEALILISDGEDTEGGLDEAIQRTKERGVRVYTVGIGTTEGELIPLEDGTGFVKDREGQVVKSRLNEETLQKVGLETGGAYVRGVGAALGLDQLFDEHISKMERRDVSSALERRYEERFQIPLAAALLLLVLEALLPDRVPSASGRRWISFVRRKRREEPPTLAKAAMLLLALFPFLVGFFDPPADRAAEGNDLFHRKKYVEAAEKYREGLVDAPASPLLQYNLGTALYQQGQYKEAAEFFSKLLAQADASWVARGAYNLGHAQYQIGAAAEASSPQTALSSYAQALAAYRRAMNADPADPDPKLAYEIVERKMKDLQKRLEEQQQQQEEQQQEQAANEQQPQDSPNQGEQQQDEQPQHQQEAAGEQTHEEATQEQTPEPQPHQPEQASAGEQIAPEPPQTEESQTQPSSTGVTTNFAEAQDPNLRAAQAILDTARSEELGPEDIRRPGVIMDIGEPLRDW